MVTLVQLPVTSGCTPLRETSTHHQRHPRAGLSSGTKDGCILRTSWARRLSLAKRVRLQSEGRVSQDLVAKDPGCSYRCGP